MDVIGMPQGPPRKKRHWLRWTLIGIGLLVVLVVVLAVANSGIKRAPAAAPAVASAPAVPVATPSSSPALTVAPVGTLETFTNNGSDAFTVNPDQVQVTSQPADQYSSGPANGFFVSIHVSVAALTDGQSVNQGDFYVKVGQARYDEGSGNSYSGPHSSSGLGYQNLNAGDHAGGWLSFDSSSAHGKLAYAPNYNGGPLQYWTY